ncbi:TonB-dependent receptor domain-containing protein, partial [Vibrio parahaemolyticus]
KQEKSKNFSLGTTFKPSRDVDVTVDLYQINIRDRIVLSGRFDAINFPEIAPLLNSLGVEQTAFFVNSVNTRTRGLDLTA